MKTITDALKAQPQISDYKINVHNKQSTELFYVKGRLETVRRTDSCDKEVTVYVRHGEYLGDARFFVYASTTPQQLAQRIEEAVGKALLIDNPVYTLPEGDAGPAVCRVESNFEEYEPAALAHRIAKTVHAAVPAAESAAESTALNAVEVFVNRHTERVINSRGLDKTQVRYDAMVEAIPTCNGEAMSVELYEQYNFSRFDEQALSARIAARMAEVRARYRAAAPAAPLAGRVVLHAQELGELFWNIADNADYATVYSRSGLFQKGDAVQKDRTGDPIGITAAGQVPGSCRSAVFDTDGLTLGSIRVVEDGRMVNYFGSNRYGQYLGEQPTGVLGCLCVDAGTADEETFAAAPYLEVLSMSGLQVDFYSDYIGGEVRLALWHENGSAVPVTGISIAGKLSEVLGGIRFSRNVVTEGSCRGPETALLENMQIF